MSTALSILARLTCTCAALTHRGESHCWNCGVRLPLPGQARHEKTVRERRLRAIAAVEFGGVYQ